MFVRVVVKVFAEVSAEMEVLSTVLISPPDLPFLSFWIEIVF